MKKCAIALVLLGLLGCQSPGQKSTKLETKKDTISYSIGLNLGNSLQHDSVSINPDVFLQGVLDASADSAKRMLTNKEVGDILEGFMTELRDKRIAQLKASGEKNKAEGEKFLAENAKNPDIVTLPSGLQYRVLVMGKGKKPTAKSTVTAHYIGKLLDGTEFDNSYKRGEPATFPVTNVIKGWMEGLQIMKAGSKYEFFIPPDLAYGEKGAGGVIPPSAMLIFQVELIAVK
jgi:FKBP-type peptidyl-prolyl cis-trans isomerase